MAKKTIKPKYGPLTIDGEQFSVRLNPPLSAFAGLQSGDFSRVIGSLRVIVKSHPYVDDAGAPLDVGDFDEDVTLAVIEGYGTLQRAIPKASGTASDAE